MSDAGRPASADEAAGTFGFVTPENLPLFTDLYELTMMQGYLRQGHNPTATFDLFFRELPPDRGYLVFAGLEQVLAYLDGLHFGERCLDYLAGEGFSGEFLDYLADFEFTGEVLAVPEGTAVFETEPVIEVTAPIVEAQLLETVLINQVGFQSLIATKAARMVDVVERYGSDQALVDFGSRRGHGTDAGVKAARAAYLGGFAGTSNVAAGEVFDIPVFGTMAHSWVQSFPTEREAFRAFAVEYPETAVLLIDTYDTVAGARLAMAVADELDVDLAGVRIDSGDLAALSKRVAEVIDGDVDLFVSSGMEERSIRAFLEAGGIADGFGPGTALATSSDAPKVEAVYKLVGVEVDGEMRPSMKLSAGKVTYPGRKQVGRVSDATGYVRDVVGLRGEDLPGEALLEPAVVAGETVGERPSLEAVRDRRRRSLARVPEAVRRVDDPERYEVSISDALESVTARLEADLEAHVGEEN